MSRVIEGFEALMVLALAVTFGGAVVQLRDKATNVRACIQRSSQIAFVSLAVLVGIKFTSDKVVGFLYDRWHLLAYTLAVVVAAGLAILYRSPKKSVPLAWVVIALAAGTGIALHLFW